MGFFRDEGKVYKPVKELDLSSDSTEPYIEAHVKAPRMAGFVIKIFTWLLELRAFGTMVVYFLKRQNLIHKLVTCAMLEEPPVFVPFHSSEDLKEQEVMSIQPDLSPSEKVEQAIDCLPLCSKPILAAQHGFKRWTIQDYSRAYISRETTPLMVATRFLAAVHESSNSPLKMSFFINYSSEDILKQATESTHRYELGTPISILDGVPIAIKDEIDCMPYPTTGGTKWLQNFRPCTNDACCVKHLRSCGAILVGKSNMHELGAGTSGINPHYGVARNPYDSKRISGGSSSGSAALVSAGLCPAALGVDGGGSVRMPAALCGVVGLKPSFGRVSHLGVLPLNWTVGMVGILAATIEDAFILYAAISSHLPSNQPTSLKPKINLPLLKSKITISNIKMAIYKEWFNDCNDEIRNCCYEALDKLCKNYAWKIVEVTIPDIETMRLAHYITIGSECTTSLASLLKTLKTSELGWDARVALRVYGSFSSKDYLNAQRIRNRQMHIHKDIFKSADVIVTPTTGVTAYPITETAVKYGEFDYVNGAALVRYQIAGNFLGLPAVTVPVGYDKVGMPIGLQFIGRPFSEATLLHISYAMQCLCISSCRKPMVSYDLLSKQ